MTINQNKIYLGDCLELMPFITDKSIDMILCDLPYGTTQNKWDSIIDLPKLWSEYKRVIKDNGAIVLTAQTPFDKVLGYSNLEMLKYELIWEKSKATGFLNAKKIPLKAHENILIFYKQQPTYNPQMTKGEPYNKGFIKAQNGNGTYGNFDAKLRLNESGDRFPRSVFYFKTSEAEGKVVHPTQKPVALFEYLIKTYTNKGETVLDNCIGSGTTAIACKNIGCNFIGIEKGQEYFDLATNRINNHQPRLNLE
jgi:site-specific DNA-methyltransferase (adenine-specific)